MIGNSYNKKKILFLFNRDQFSNSKSGQVLLITVMLLATIMTVTLAVTFRSNTETQTTKLEEESQKALAAAEAGIEAALQPGAGTVTISNLPGLAGFGGQAIPGNFNSHNFLTPLLNPDKQYTFYLADYSNNLNSGYYNGNLTVYYGSETTDCSTVALEISIIYNSGSNINIKRYIADTGKKLNGPSTDPNNIGFSGAAGNPFLNQTFSCNAQIGVIDNTKSPKLILVRALLISPTKLGFVGSNTLPNQGKYITSTATSQTGVTKKVQLFQSYPQIPAEFFVTSF